MASVHQRFARICTRRFSVTKKEVGTVKIYLQARMQHTSGLISKFERNASFASSDLSINILKNCNFNYSPNYIRTCYKITRNIKLLRKVIRFDDRLQYEITRENKRNQRKILRDLDDAYLNYEAPPSLF